MSRKKWYLNWTLEHVAKGGKSVFMRRIHYVHRFWAEVKRKKRRVWINMVWEAHWKPYKIFAIFSLEQWMPVIRRVNWQIRTLKKKYLTWKNKKLWKSMLILHIFSSQKSHSKSVQFKSLALYSSPTASFQKQKFSHQGHRFNDLHRYKHSFIIERSQWGPGALCRSCRSENKPMIEWHSPGISLVVAETVERLTVLKYVGVTTNKRWRGFAWLLYLMNGHH